MKLTKSGLELKEVIEKAMKDHIITNSEYEEIMKVANKDGMVDDHEQRYQPTPGIVGERYGRSG